MPASLFAAWAGQQPRVTYEAASATGAIFSSKPSSSAGFTDIQPNHDDAEAVAPTPPLGLVTGVTGVQQGWLPEKG
jgi:hypothetical protein